MDETKVVFEISNKLIQKLFDSAEEKCRLNVKSFAGKKVLIEGGGYNKVWIETQPMGGAMYAKRDLEVAYNNQKIFMDHQREDGRLPGSIECRDGRLIPQFDKFQGFCFPGPALDVYYLTGKNNEYLDQLYEVLRKYDEYLWKVRDSDNDGCLESWCKYDTGEDNAVRYGNAPDYWESDKPPRGFDVVPMASMDFMSFSYAAKDTMARIAQIKGDSSLFEYHRIDADALKLRIKIILWDEEKGAFFDRDKNHRLLPTLTHNNLRMMYWNSMTRDEAEIFVKKHLLNEKEFWTNMPLPSVSISDPLYRNYGENNWSGQSQALTYQRAITALENYGYYDIIPRLGRKLFEAIGINCVFVQQYDPITMKPSLNSVAGGQDAYGPAMLAVLEYISRMYGVVVHRDRLIWSSVKEDTGLYEQHMNGHVYRLEHEQNKAYAVIDGKQIFSFERGKRVETDLSGKEHISSNDL
ncbi:MAG: hypothetical protein J6O61_11850 [Butyrivibrio sp.]|uniref:MGH1-like glycoside hydrolase domain-containing protein n=1 Tax=Butyrivibrio sp. TaxID=28121 RepID=UPI001B0C86A2|nr:trehalase family glycosidase [Butyrivibrio sp.]MBO6241509.1 hypothetical protein [Butyrivibrio sp.]